MASLKIDRRGDEYSFERRTMKPTKRFPIVILFAFLMTTQVSFAEIYPTYAIVNCTIFPVKGERIDQGVIIIRDGLIESLGPKAQIVIPEEAEMIEAEGLFVYPGLIDAHTKLLLASPKTRPQPQEGPSSAQAGESPAWQKADFFAFDHLNPQSAILDGLRKIGITTVCVAPDKDVFSGQSVILNLSSESKKQIVLRNPFALHLNFATYRGEYPTSLMGTVSLLRQKFLDAGHYHLYAAQYAQSPLGLRRPSFDPFLETIIPYVIHKKPIVFNCANLEDIKRSVRLIEEFKLNAVISGANEAWRVPEFITNAKVPLWISLKFTPPFTSTYVNQTEELKKKAEEILYPANAANLHREGIAFALTSNGLSKPDDILKNVQKAIKAGLPKEEALRAMTIHPAAALGIDDVLGSLEVGKIANVIVMSGEIFDEKAQVRQVFVDGIAFEIKHSSKDPRPSATDVSGNWQAEIVSPMGTLSCTLEFQQEGNSVQGTIISEMGQWPINDAVLNGKELIFSITANIMGESMTLEFNGTAEPDVIEGNISFMQGSAQLRAVRIPDSNS